MANDLFKLVVREVNPVTGRGGILIFGTVESGVINVGDKVQITGGWLARNVVVAGIQLGTHSVQSAKTGDWIGILIDGLNLADVQRGEIVATPIENAAAKKE